MNLTVTSYGNDYLVVGHLIGDHGSSSNLGSGLSRNGDFLGSGLADFLAFLLCGSGNNNGYILIAARDDVGILNLYTVNINMNLTITGYGNDYLVVGHLIGDHGSCSNLNLSCLGDYQGLGTQVNSSLIGTCRNLEAVGVGTQLLLDAQLIFAQKVVLLDSTQTIGLDGAPILVLSELGGK